KIDPPFKCITGYLAIMNADINGSLTIVYSLRVATFIRGCYVSVLYTADQFLIVFDGSISNQHQYSSRIVKCLDGGGFIYKRKLVVRWTEIAFAESYFGQAQVIIVNIEKFDVFEKAYRFSTGFISNSCRIDVHYFGC